jgi:hypothetical protein
MQKQRPTGVNIIAALMIIISTLENANANYHKGEFA